MSELIDTTIRTGSIRRRLLATVSAFALLASIGGIGKAEAGDDAGRPDVWIELGGQLDQFASTQGPFAPPFLRKTPPAFETVTPVEAQKPPRFAIGGDAKATFEPAGTHWVFSASVRYGRSNGDKTVHQQTLFPSVQLGLPSNHIPPRDDGYATSKIRINESHAIADFQAGKDVGLGMFGRDSTSIFSLGVRYAQFASTTAADIRDRPDLHVRYFTFPSGGGKAPLKYYHAYHLTGHSARSFQAIGPSLSWDASAPFAGNQEAAEFTFDWGAEAAILFGRQKAAVSHQTTGHYFKQKYGAYNQAPPYTNAPAPRNGAHTLTIPNLGGFAGVSVKWPNAKVGLGYRADFFFGAVDGGIDRRISKTLGLNGPFASISIGL